MRILLITDIAPCTNYTAGIVLNKWCDFLIEENHEIYYALVKNKSLEFEIPEDKKSRIHFLNIEKPRENFLLPEATKWKLITEIMLSLLYQIKFTCWDRLLISREIIEFAKENKCELIFVSIQGQTITRLIRRVARKTGLKYVAQAWDPLEWWLRAHNFDYFSKKINLSEFNKLVKGSEKFAAMSWAMSVEFEKKYGITCVTNIPGLKSGVTVKQKNLDSPDSFNIAFAGQLYAKKEFEVFVEALDKMGWKYGGKKISLNLYGMFLEEKYKKLKQVNFHGYVNQEQLIPLLVQADLLYCPYWFSKEFIKEATLSFPSKLTSYLKTGKPVFIHAPKYASPRKFLEHFKAAYICGSVDVNVVMNSIKDIIDDSNRKNIGRRGYQLFEKYMTYKPMKESFLHSINLNRSKNLEEFESLRKIYQ